MVADTSDPAVHPKRSASNLPLDNSAEPEMLYRMGGNGGAGEPHEEIVVDPRESMYELPPIEHAPFADAAEKKVAVRRVIKQAERERAAAAAHDENA